MKIEVISRRPRRPSKHPPLVFVHGAYGGAWIWDQHFLPFFAERGYEAHALSLRGHGESGGWEQLAFARLSDYVADLEQVALAMPTPAGADRPFHGRHGRAEVHARAPDAGGGAHGLGAAARR